MTTQPQHLQTLDRANLKREVRAQHLQALDKANQTRIDAANLKREVREGNITITDAFNDDRAAPLTCERLLSTQRGWGKERTGRFCNRLMINPGKKIRSLTTQQKTRIIDAFNDRDTNKVDLNHGG